MMTVVGAVMPRYRRHSDHQCGSYEGGGGRYDRHEDDRLIKIF